MFQEYEKIVENSYDVFLCIQKWNVISIYIMLQIYIFVSAHILLVKWQFQSEHKVQFPFDMKHLDSWLLLKISRWRLSDNIFLLYYLVLLFPQYMRLWKNQSIYHIKTGRLMTNRIPIWISYNLKNKSYSNTLNLSFWSILIMISCRVNNYATNVFICNFII